MNKKSIFIFITAIFILFAPISYGAENCTEATDCQESINENTYNIQESLNNLSTYLQVDEENPITLITLEQYEEYNENMTELLQVIGVFCGLMLFANFFSLGLFIYKR